MTAADFDGLTAENTYVRNTKKQVLWEKNILAFLTNINRILQPSADLLIPFDTGIIKA